MSRENDREVKLPSDGTESTEMDRSRHIPKMDVTNNSTFKELEQWRMMYENSFFNPLPTVQTGRTSDLIFVERTLRLKVIYTKIKLDWWDSSKKVT